MIYALIFWGGTLFGFCLCLWYNTRTKSYGGVITVGTDEESEKLTYSLVLFEPPAELMFRKDIRFKITSSEEL